MSLRPSVQQLSAILEPLTYVSRVNCNAFANMTYDDMCVHSDRVITQRSAFDCNSNTIITHISNALKGNKPLKKVYDDMGLIANAMVKQTSGSFKAK